MYDPHKGVKKPIKVVDHTPTDWIELKSLLEEAMQTIWFLDRTDEAILTLERHYAGKFTVKFRQYSVYLMPTSRRPQASFRASLNPKNGRLNIRSAQFAPELHFLKLEYQQIERGQIPKPPPLFPKHYKTAIEEPKQLLAEQTGLRYPNYSSSVRQCYGYVKSGRLYREMKRKPILHYSTLIQKTKQEAKKDDYS